MEPIDPDATRPFHYRSKPDCPPKTTPGPTGERQVIVSSYLFLMNVLSPDEDLQILDETANHVSFYGVLSFADTPF